MLIKFQNFKTWEHLKDTIIKTKTLCYLQIQNKQKQQEQLKRG